MVFQLYAERGSAGDGVPDALEGGVETALAQSREVVGGGPEEVRVGEVEGGLGILLVAAVGEEGVVVEGGEGAEVARVREQEVQEDLGVEGPVAGVVEDEDGGDAEGGWGAGGGEE